MKKYFTYISVISVLFNSSCVYSKKQTGTDDGSIKVNFIQINDVYEIEPIEAGKVGGMARVASLKKNLQSKNINTYLLMVGDFLSPSVYNILSYEGSRIRGKQMVDAMNAAGTDLVVFGNHEFDISEKELQTCIDRSQFQWISSNSFNKTNDGYVPFGKLNNDVKTNFPETYIMKVKDADGTTAKIGFIGINLPFNKAAYVRYSDPLATAVKLYNQIKDSCDVVIALTHQFIEDDIKLAKALPELGAIMGGHEHNNRFVKEGNVTISKAHANARSAYVIEMKLNKKSGKKSFRYTLKNINESIDKDAATDAVVQHWSAIATANYASLGFNPTEVLMDKGPEYDAREEMVRKGSSNFTKLVVNAMEAACPKANVAIINAGSIRLDDVLVTPITSYDIIRSLPFGGGITELDIKGSLLKQILTAGKKNLNIGGFLHYSAAAKYDAINQVWLFNNKSIDDEQIFRVAITDFLLTGGETNMGFLTKNNSGIVKLYPASDAVTATTNDIRQAIVQYMKKLYVITR
jgi:5'-nucleotidase